MEERKGILAELIYHNKENGYTIALIETEETGEPFTAVGYLQAPDKGRTFLFKGSWKTHPTYGEQFAFDSYHEEIPQSLEGIQGFLASGVLKGIGPKTAATIVKRFGEDALRIIEEEPGRLTEIEGIGKVKAASVAEAFRAHREFARIVLYFQQYGISTGYAMKLYKVYGTDTIKAVEENPYQLVDDIFGIGFRKADKIAEKLGMDPHDPHRIKSGIDYGLWAFVNEGHTFVPLKHFCEKAAELMDISSEEVHETLVEMAFDGDLHIETIEGRAVIYPMAYFLAEQKVTRKLMEIERAVLKPVNAKVDELIDLTERQTGIKLSENQRLAVKASLGNGVTVITGGPGTGKTTIINTIMAILVHSGFKTVIAAPTGRAA